MAGSWFDPRCAHDRQTRMVRPCGRARAKNWPNAGQIGGVSWTRAHLGNPSGSMAPDRGRPPSRSRRPSGVAALIIDPGEAHTFLTSSDDYLHFVIHAPGLVGDEARREKHLV